MPDSKLQHDPLRLHASDADRPVVIHPEDDDVFVLTGKQAIEACQLGISIELWLSELRSMLATVSDWTRQRSERVQTCYAVPRDARIVLFFLPTSATYDFDLADELVELNTSLIKDFNIGMIEIHQVPERELARFVDLSRARQIYDRSAESHPAVGA